MISVYSAINRLGILRLRKLWLTAEICGKTVLERVIPSSRMVEATHKQEKARENNDTTWISELRPIPMTSD